jgi:hypothetical protein
VSANTRTLNTAIATVGSSATGGTVCLPAGTYFLAPPDLRAAEVTSVLIDVNNLTLWGAGMDGSKGGTRLRTRSTWSLVDGNVVRGVGLWIKGTPSLPARQNITVRDLELDGGAGYTGNYGWPADPATGDGWDLSHKGIIVSANANVDNVTLERVWVHAYRGEVIYAGGSGMGRLTLRGVRSEDTNASTYNVTAQATVEDSYFGKSRFWIEIGTAFGGKSGTFRNNTFADASIQDGIALTQGDGGAQTYLFEGNRFERCPGAAFAFLGGIGGPVTVRGNTFVDCGGFFTSLAPNPLPAADARNQNITFENNTLSGGPYLANFFGTDRTIVVRGNTFDGKGGATAVFYCCGNFQNLTVEGNTFKNLRGPERSGDFSGTRPLFQNNTYTNLEIREGQSSVRLYGDNGTLSPLFERSWVTAQPGSVTGLILDVSRYPDGQETTIEVRAGTVQLPASAPTYQLLAARTLTAGSQLRLRFNAAQNKWLEVSP